MDPADVEAPEPPPRDPKSNPSNDELHDLLKMDMRMRERAPLHIFILYGLSIVALWEYTITLTAPLDDYRLLGILEYLV